MTDYREAPENPSTMAGNAIKNPQERGAAGERMSDARRARLKTLSEQAGKPLDATLSKAEAAKRIDRLQDRAGRGQPDRH